jgi:hypothetical protein
MNTDIEIWKDVPEYEGHYQVSSLGNVKSIKFNKEIILKTSKNRKGYFYVGLLKNGKRKTMYNTKLVAMAFLGHVPCGMELVVDHKNRIRIDNSLKNLRIVTNRENSNNKDKSKTSSKYSGVHWSIKAKKWISQIYFNKKRIHLGCFGNEEEASLIYTNAVKSIEKGEEIVSNKKIKYSKYKGVSWKKQTKKWSAHITINKKLKHLGYFFTEKEAYNAYKKFKKENSI